MSQYFSAICNAISRNSGEFTFVLSRFNSNSLLQEKRVLSLQEQNQLNYALKIRREFGFSFWESIMSTYFDRGQIEFTFLIDVLNHHKNIDETTFSSEQIKEIDNFIEANKDENIAFVSKVKQGEKKRHVPMIDFHIPPSKNNLVVVEKVIEVLNLKSGFIIDSGKSYHFIGAYLIGEKELIKLLTNMIFFAPIIDRNWIAHQLLEKKCALRITKGTKAIPHIIKCI